MKSFFCKLKTHSQYFDFSVKNRFEYEAKNGVSLIEQKKIASDRARQIEP